MEFKEYILESRTKIFLGRNSEDNDKLVSFFKGKENVILHTVAPGSPFCVINSLKSGRVDIEQAAVACAAKSKNWRDNKSDVKLHQFTGKDVYKSKKMEVGSWLLRNRPKIILAKKEDIEKWILKYNKK